MIDLRKKHSRVKNSNSKKGSSTSQKVEKNTKSKNKENQEKRFANNIRLVKESIALDRELSVTLIFVEERYDLKTSKTYKKESKQVFPISQKMIKGFNKPVNLLLTINDIAKDRGASYYIIS